MEPFIVSIYPELTEPASMHTLDGTLPLSSYHVGGMRLETPEGVEYHLQLTNTGEGVVLAGKVSCSALGECARCLAPAKLDIEGDVEGYYLLEPAEEMEDYEQDEFECVDEGGNFDIAPAIEAALVYATPYVVLCKEDCAGLCPTCGADLNEGPCSCSDEEEIDPLNPFAVLKNLDLGEDE